MHSSLGVPPLSLLGKERLQQMGEFPVRIERSEWLSLQSHGDMLGP